MRDEVRKGSRHQDIKTKWVLCGGCEILYPDQAAIIIIIIITIIIIIIIIITLIIIIILILIIILIIILTREQTCAVHARASHVRSIRVIRVISKGGGYSGHL